LSEALQLQIIEIAMATLIALMVALIYLNSRKDEQMQRRIRKIATVVEELHRHLYAEDMKAQEMQQQLEFLLKKGESTTSSDADNALVSLRQQFEKELVVAQNAQQNLHERIVKLEDALRALQLPSSVQNSDDGKIIKLFQEGVSVDQIAKKLLLPHSEIEFVLKINKLK